jgi:uracil-DNA glycosylase
LTRRRSSYRSLASLQRDLRACRACVEAGYHLESLPVVNEHLGQHAYMYGQAPGIVEGEERRPWRGRAGKTLRRWLELEEDQFYETFYCASVTRCYPGRAPSSCGDRTPTPRDIDARHRSRLNRARRTLRELLGDIGNELVTVPCEQPDTARRRHGK